MSNPFIEKAKKNPFLEKAGNSLTENVSIGDPVRITWTFDSYALGGAAEMSHEGMVAELDDWIRVEHPLKGYAHLPISGLRSVEGI